ncbi:Hsp33 family molecular chaperone [Maritalea mediterranea]|uniref:Hsp33 family molecular chaperone n=1 Tax=Maritalea mediterranea TaxID=2909667 RepID=A0ABS9E470_9HYPH|nr:Hsp33 family molecular chaperone [Maritalea mediterranea]MCF4097588.1 Hsp33 family molecular chaperone [Maritalea mediterranea]
MTDDFLKAVGLDREESFSDKVVPFAVEDLDVRGRSVKLDDALNTILTRHDYPTPVARLLGEAIVLAAVVGSSLKFEGRFILQTQTDGPVNMIVVDLQTPNGLRGYARFDEVALSEAAEKGELAPEQLLGKGILAMTIDQGEMTERYQGIVQLDGASLEEVAHRYFMQSEQIPTIVRLAVAQYSEKGKKQDQWRAGGILLQHLPEHGRRTMADLPGDGDFDNPETQDETFEPENNWVEASSLLKTVDDHELVDPEISVERLLFRLYHETGVRVFDPMEMIEKCGCNADKIEAMLDQFSNDDIDAMVVDGDIEVVCEFCSTAYHFNPHQFRKD